MIGPVPDELIDQVTIGPVNFHAIEPGSSSIGYAFGEIGGHFADASAIQRYRRRTRLRA